jgi:hypothetical protein
MELNFLWGENMNLIQNEVCLCSLKYSLYIIDFLLDKNNLKEA